MPCKSSVADVIKNNFIKIKKSNLGLGWKKKTLIALTAYNSTMYIFISIITGVVPKFQYLYHQNQPPVIYFMLFFSTHSQSFQHTHLFFTYIEGNGSKNFSTQSLSLSLSFCVYQRYPNAVYSSARSHVCI